MGKRKNRKRGKKNSKRSSEGLRGPEPVGLPGNGKLRTTSMPFKLGRGPHGRGANIQVHQAGGEGARSNIRPMGFQGVRPLMADFDDISHIKQYDSVSGTRQFDSVPINTRSARGFAPGSQQSLVSGPMSFARIGGDMTFEESFEKAHLKSSEHYKRFGPKNHLLQCELFDRLDNSASFCPKDSSEPFSPVDDLSASILQQRSLNETMPHSRGRITDIHKIEEVIIHPSKSFQPEICCICDRHVPNLLSHANVQHLPWFVYAPTACAICLMQCNGQKQQRLHWQNEHPTEDASVAPVLWRAFMKEFMNGLAKCLCLKLDEIATYVVDNELGNTSMPEVNRAEQPYYDDPTFRDLPPFNPFQPHNLRDCSHWRIILHLISRTRRNAFQHLVRSIFPKDGFIFVSSIDVEWTGGRKMDEETQGKGRHQDRGAIKRLDLKYTDSKEHAPGLLIPHSLVQRLTVAMEKGKLKLSPGIQKVITDLIKEAKTLHGTKGNDHFEEKPYPKREGLRDDEETSDQIEKHKPFEQFHSKAQGIYVKGMLPSEPDNDNVYSYREGMFSNPYTLEEKQEGLSEVKRARDQYPTKEIQMQDSPESMNREPQKYMPSQIVNTTDSIAVKQHRPSQRASSTITSLENRNDQPTMSPPNSDDPWTSPPMQDSLQAVEHSSTLPKRPNVLPQRVEEKLNLLSEGMAVLTDAVLQLNKAINKNENGNFTNNQQF